MDFVVCFCFYQPQRTHDKNSILMTLFHKNSIKSIFLKLKIYLGKGNFIFVGSSTDEWAANVPSECVRHSRWISVVTHGMISPSPNRLRMKWRCWRRNWRNSQRLRLRQMLIAGWDKYEGINISRSQSPHNLIKEEIILTYEEYLKPKVSYYLNYHTDQEAKETLWWKVLFIFFFPIKVVPNIRQKENV